MSDDELNEKRFDVSVQIRNLEIDLFWKRSLFFWGFISAAFVGYSAIKQPTLRSVVACFGMVCSVAWSLVNRGSKYWQESWETKVERFETAVTGVLFAQEESPQSHKGCWLRGRKYSVSKLAIALSDYVSILWIIVVIGEGVRPYVPLPVRPWLGQTGTTIFIVFSLLYVVMLLIFGRKSSRLAE
jgi:hypothetical protein